ncbi:S1C family serine protease [Cupriavidus pauculus]|nr:serine protease [Cupriavidus pauculus]
MANFWGRRLASRCVVMALASATLATAAHAMDAADLYDRRAPSIWVVKVFDGQKKQTGVGSAVATGKDELTTNCHVLRNAKSVSVVHTGKTLPATLRHADPERDLCILVAPGINAPVVPIAPISSIRVGQRVYAIGAPRGLELTLSDGLIASLHRNETGELTQIQISVPVSPGSSGGGLFDTDGRLIGVPYMTLREAQNVNFAIPSTWIAEVPARSAVAVANYRAEVAARNAATAAAVATAGTLAARGPQLGRKLNGAEIREHYRTHTHFFGRDPSDVQYTFDFDGGGKMGVKHVWTRGNAYSDGSFTVAEDSDQVCLTMNNPRFIAMTSCYELYDNAGKFTLKSVSREYALTYPDAEQAVQQLN